ncbi:MAG: Hsp20/alpha crystallin family protein [Bacillota bacterium]
MRDLLRREPRGDMDRVRTGLDRFFDDAFFRNMPFGGQATFPAVDLYDTEDALVAKVDLPGVSAEDVEVSTNADTLTISGEIKAETEEGDTVWQERIMGRFYRSFKLPATIKPDGVEANFKAGVLRINMPKTEERKGRTIKIKDEG